jgi:hypothetical protein
MGDEIPLETPTEIACPLCNGTEHAHETQLRSNKADQPMFTCHTLGTTVNMRDGEVDAWEFSGEWLTNVELNQQQPADVEDDDPEDVAALLEDETEPDEQPDTDDIDSLLEDLE